MSPKMCELDPIPVDLLKQALDGLLPTLTKIVNLSVGTATFPKSWKAALIKPLLKKIGLELIKSNYRPVSNLSFLSKLKVKVLLLYSTARLDSFSSTLQPYPWQGTHPTLV